MSKYNKKVRLSMRKIVGLIFLIVICFFSVACEKQTSESEQEEVLLDHIAFEYNGELIELDASMPSKDVFHVIHNLLNSKDNRIKIMPYYIQHAYQKEDSTFRLKKSKNAYAYGMGLYDEEATETYQSIYKSYSSMYSQTDDETIKSFEISKSSSIKKNDESKDTHTYLKVYGKQNTLHPQDEGYQQGDLERHYTETMYYDTNQYHQTVEKGTYTKHYNSWKDMIESILGKPDFISCDSELISDRISFQPEIIMIDDVYPQFCDFVSYDFSLTQNHIILKYYSKISLMNLQILFDISVTDELIEELHEREEMGEYYALEVHLDYTNIFCLDDIDYIFADYISQENKIIFRDSGVYGNEYNHPSIVGKEYDLYEETLSKSIFSHLNLDFAAVESLKEALISSVTAK